MILEKARIQIFLWILTLGKPSLSRLKLVTQLIMWKLKSRTRRVFFKTATPPFFKCVALKYTTTRPRDSELDNRDGIYRDWKCLYVMYCVISHSLTGVCSVFRVLDVAIHTKNKQHQVECMLCCCWLVMISLQVGKKSLYEKSTYKMKKSLQAPLKTREHCFKIILYGLAVVFLKY